MSLVLYRNETVVIQSFFQKALPRIVSSPDPTLCEEKGLVTLERFLGLAHAPSRDSIELNVLSHMNAKLAQPRNRSNVTRPFSSQRVGSGDETIARKTFATLATFLMLNRVQFIP